MLAEVNVSDDELREYFGQADGNGTRVLMVFAFRLNQALILALAREDARPVTATLVSCRTVSARPVGDVPAQPRRG